MGSNKKINVKERYTDGEVDLSMSDLSDVPVKDIIALKKVTSLDVSNNRLVTLPKNFPTLVTLTKLDLSKNELKQLPNDFGNLTKLRYLDLYQNQLTHLPLSFHKLKELKFLDLKDNPLVPTVGKVAGPCLDTKQCQSCAKDIVNFFTKLQEQVDNEVEMRTKDRQRQLELNEKKKQEEKKNKKKDKQKQNKEVQETRKNKQKVVESIVSREIKKTAIKKTEKQKSKGHSVWFYLIVTSILTIVGLFCATSISWTYTEFIQKYVTNLYSDSLKNIPDSIWKERLIQSGNLVYYSHTKTGEYILRTAEYLKSIETVRNIGVIIGELVDYSKNKIGEIYGKIVK